MPLVPPAAADPTSSETSAAASAARAMARALSEHHWWSSDIATPPSIPSPHAQNARPSSPSSAFPSFSTPSSEEVPSLPSSFRLREAPTLAEPVLSRDSQIDSAIQSIVSPLFDQSHGDSADPWMRMTAWPPSMHVLFDGEMAGMPADPELPPVVATSANSADTEVQKCGDDAELFTSPVSDKFICLICQGVLHQPATACNGGHLFCLPCLSDWRRVGHGRTCPTCRLPLTTRTVVIGQLQAYLGELEVRCADGCPWRGPRCEMAAHTHECAERPTACPFAHVGCSAKLRRREMDAHVASAASEHGLLTVKAVEALRRDLKKERAARLHAVWEARELGGAIASAQRAAETALAEMRELREMSESAHLHDASTTEQMRAELRAVERRQRAVERRQRRARRADGRTRADADEYGDGGHDDGGGAHDGPLHDDDGGEGNGGDNGGGGGGVDGVGGVGGSGGGVGVGGGVGGDVGDGDADAETDGHVAPETARADARVSAHANIAEVLAHAGDEQVPDSFPRVAAAHVRRGRSPRRDDILGIWRQSERETYERHVHEFARESARAASRDDQFAREDRVAREIARELVRDTIRESREAARAATRHTARAAADTEAAAATTTATGTGTTAAVEEPSSLAPVSDTHSPPQSPPSPPNSPTRRLTLRRNLHSFGRQDSSAVPTRPRASRGSHAAQPMRAVVAADPVVAVSASNSFAAAHGAAAAAAHGAAAAAAAAATAANAASRQSQQAQLAQPPPLPNPYRYHQSVAPPPPPHTQPHAQPHAQPHSHSHAQTHAEPHAHTWPRPPPPAVLTPLSSHASAVAGWTADTDAELLSVLSSESNSDAEATLQTAQALTNLHATDARTNARTDAQLDARPDTRRGLRRERDGFAETRNDARSDPRTDARHEIRAEARTEARTQVRTEPRHEARAHAWYDVLSDPYSDVFSAPALRLEREWPRWRRSPPSPRHMPRAQRMRTRSPERSWRCPGCSLSVPPSLPMCFRCSTQRLQRDSWGG